MNDEHNDLNGRKMVGIEKYRERIKHSRVKPPLKIRIYKIALTEEDHYKFLDLFRNSVEKGNFIKANMTWIK